MIINKTKQLCIMSCLVLFFISFIAPVLVIPSFADDEDEDGIANDIEELNYHQLDIQVSDNLSLINSWTENEVTNDEFQFEVSTGSDGLSLKLAYNSDSESAEIDLEFQVIFYALIEYVDIDANGMYNSSVDTFINQLLLNSFQSINYTLLETGSNTAIHILTIATTDGVFSTRIYAVQEFELINNTLITPAEIKIDIEIHNFNFTIGNSDLALGLKLVSSVEYEIEHETDDEKAGYAENETEVETTSNGYTGFFSWSETALIDGIEKIINSSPVIDGGGDQEIFINYPRGTHILHDPKIGIEGILRFPTPLNLLIIIVLIIVIASLSFCLVLTQQEYREYLLTRILHINPEPHRLSMEDVLENKKRSEIINIILEEPGIHFNELLRKTGVSAGNLAWHIDILESYKIIQKRRVGQYLIFYSYLEKNPFRTLDPKLMKSRTTLDIFQLISDNPGMYQNQIAKRLDLNHKTIKYHLHKLLEADLIYSEKKSGNRRFYPKINPIEEEPDKMFSEFPTNLSPNRDLV